MSESERTIRALIAQWRKEAADEITRLKQYEYGGPLDGDMLDEDIGLALSNAHQKRKCADELERAMAKAEATP